MCGKSLVRAISVGPISRHATAITMQISVAIVIAVAAAAAASSSAEIYQVRLRRFKDVIRRGVVHKGCPRATTSVAASG